MAGFGGSVKLTGETEYKKALREITENLREISSEMKMVSSAYDKNDSSLEALTAKEDVLNRKLEEQNNKMDLLKARYRDMEVAYAGITARHDSLVESYDEEKDKLVQIENELGKSSDEYKAQARVVELLEEAVKESAKEEENSAKSMSKMRVEMNNAQTDINKTERELRDLGNSAEDAGDKAVKSGEGFTVFKGILADLGASAIKSVLGGIKQLSGALVDVGKQAMSGYAEFEQLEGDVKKIFGDDMAQDVIANAERAYYTAGMSANEYLDTVTSFSASLMQSLGDDTSEATTIADRAIRSMSDNANTFGTDIQSIQNAYQGFAKGNFTMLDNLKLGYGGTKTEMERLVAEASAMADSQKALGVTIDANDMSFANMANAIAVVQHNMGIAGTTIDEAGRTIQGATGSMKSAWQNMIRGMADENSNFTELAKNFVGTLISEDGQGGMLGTMIPRIATVVTGMSQAIQEGLPMIISSVVPIIQDNLPILIEAVTGALHTVLEVLPEVIPIVADLIPQIVSSIVSLLPELISAGIQIMLGLMQGISEAMPELIAMLPEIINSIVTVLIENLPLIITAGVDILLAVIQGLTEALPQLIAYLPQIIETITTVLIDNLPLIIMAGITLLVAVIQGLTQAIPQLVAMVPDIIFAIVETLVANLPQILSAGVEIIFSLIEGLLSMLGSVGESIGEIAQTILDTLLDLPSKVIQIGSDIVSGLWEGISNMVGWIGEKLSGFGESVLGGLKSFFGIASPSRLFRDEVGKNLALGIGEGFVDEMDAITDQMTDAIPTSFDVDASVSGSGGFNYATLVSAFVDALSQVKVELDGDEVGRFIDLTVARAVYE